MVANSPSVLKCTETGRDIIQRPEWINISYSKEYGTTYSIIKERIFLSQPYGYVEKKSLALTIAHIQEITNEYFKGEKGYVIIEDFSKLKGSTFEARKYFVQFLKERKRLKAIIFYGASPLVSLSIRLAKKLNIVAFNVRMADTYGDAVRLADRILDEAETKFQDSPRPVLVQSTKHTKSSRESQTPEPELIQINKVTDDRACPVTGLVITTRPEWTDIDLGEGYRVTFKFIGDRILHVAARGQAGQHGMENLFKERQKVLEAMLKPEDRYFELRDYSKIGRKITKASRIQMVKGLTPDKHRIVGFVGYQAGIRAKLAISVGSRLRKSPFPMYVVKDYQQAVKEAVKALKQDGFISQKLPITSRPDWIMEFPNFRATYEVIGNQIFHVVSSGFFDNEHIEPAYAMYERIFASGVIDKEQYYFVLGAESISGTSRTARKKYVQAIKSWYKRYPFRVYIFYGANRLLRAAINIGKHLVPFPVKTFKNLDDALELIAKDRAGDIDSLYSVGIGDALEQHVPPETVDHYVEELLNFLGNINWESDGFDENQKIQWNHPFRPVFDAISLIKEDVDELFQERKEAEDALSSEKAYLENLFENAPEGIVMSDQNHLIMRVNEEFTRIFGYTQEEAQGHHLDDLIVPPDKESRAGSQKLTDFISKNKTGSLDAIRMHKNGRPIHVSILVSPIILRGKRIGNYCIYRDISERKSFENALIENENQVRTILNSVQTGIFVIDAEEHKIIDANPAAVKIIGTSKENIVGQVCHKYVCPKEKSACPITDLGLSLNNSETTLITADGVEKTILKTVIPVNIKGKKCLLESFVDYTEKKKLEDQLRQAQKMEAIGTLAGGIAHDFNNVLYPIIGFTELTMDQVPEDSLAKKNLGEILIAANRAKDLVEHILTFSREQDEEVKPVKVQSILKEALKLLGPTIPSTVKIIQDIDNRCRPIQADPSQIHQVIMNLATNAYYAMRKKGGIIELRVKEILADSLLLEKFPDLKAGSYMRFTVGDTGHGMDKKVIERIFDPYFTTKGPGEGTGMGLAMVHGIVKKYNGEIDVQSQKGKGSTFHVYLPCIEKQPKVKEDLPDTELPGGDERILFVDDEEQITEMSRLMLERLGYTVTTRTNSVEALELFKNKSSSFDLIITDQTMPNVTGIELAQEITQIRPGLPIILCTGFSELISEESIKNAGIQSYLMKPIVMNKIANCVRKVLDEKKENQ